MVLQVRDQYTQPWFPSYTKCFYKMRPDSEDLSSLHFHGCNVLFRKLQRNFCFVFFAHALPRANRHISVFCACATHPKVASVSSGTKASATLRENWKGWVCLLLLFHEWQNPELLRGYPYFQNALLILIFQNKYGRAITVGMYGTGSLSCPPWGTSCGVPWTQKFIPAVGYQNTN